MSGPKKVAKDKEVKKDDVQQVRITAEPRLRVRKTPSYAKHVPVLTKIPQGTVVTVEGNNKGWFKVTYKGKTGYILGSFTTPVKKGPDKPAAKPATKPATKPAAKPATKPAAKPAAQTTTEVEKDAEGKSGPEPDETKDTTEESKPEEKATSTKAEEKTKPKSYAAGAAALTAKEAKAAVTNNNKKEFRIDWIRKMQKALGVATLSQDGDLDVATVQAVARFQKDKVGPKGVDGVIGGNTRTALEAAFPSLNEDVVGKNLKARTLVPGSADTKARYSYYKSIVEEAGGVFKTGNKEINLIAIRGAEVKKVGGKLEIKQTGSAGEYAKAQKKGEKNLHFSSKSSKGKGKIFDDAIITVWREKAGKDWKYHANERPGSVDPAGAQNKKGSAHLRDGQYEYKYGKDAHGTKSTNHVKTVNRLKKNNPWMYKGNVGGKTRYNALRPARNLEVIRDTNKDGNLSAKEIENSRKKINKRQDGDYYSKGTAINVHTGGKDFAYSSGCTNVTEDQYASFIKEVSGASNTQSVLYTLIDASKVNLVIKKKTKMS